MKSFKYFLIIAFAVTFLSSCDQNGIKDDFDKTPDRIWIGRNYWAVPMEEWKVNNGRVECIGNQSDMRVNVLNAKMNGENSQINLQMGILEEGERPGTAGIRIGITDNTDNDIRSLCYFGKGINIGYSTEGFLFIDDKKTELPANFDASGMSLKVSVNGNQEDNVLRVTLQDATGKTATLESNTSPAKGGIIALVNNHYQMKSNGKSPRFWFDNLSLTGEGIEKVPENAFGPILWTMYTLNDSTLKMTAQFPPLGEDDHKEVIMQIEENGEWKEVTRTEIRDDSHLALFRVNNWDPSRKVNYRVVYNEKRNQGKDRESSYEGTIRNEPLEQELTMGGLTCQFHYGFPYRPVAENLAKMDPDILYFSGDQIYESNGGYPIIRYPAERAILNYLGKWYMFGWAFGDVMRDRPTICLPDDHEVYQGNLWGNGGETLTEQQWEENRDCIAGFVEPVEMVNVVMETNTSHLPDPYDATPMKNGIKVYYTDLVYGGISFGIIGDRVFKSGPENVAFWDGRLDHLKFKPEDPSVLDKPGLQFLGERQLEFLEQWTTDWRDAQMKVLLSQTIFANSTTHHGHNKMFLYGDLDSGGWPKSARDKALEVVSKCFAFHVCGDQHLPMQLQYGINDFRDAGWVYCTPAIAVGYERRFHPDKLGWDVQNRPEHNLPNTGEYIDGFGNRNYVFAVGNPEDQDNTESRYKKANSRASGFGMIYFNKPEHEVTTEAWHFLTSENMDSENDQFPGWPVTVNVYDILKKNNAFALPEIEVENADKPVIEVTDAETGKMVYILRINGRNFTPYVPRSSTYNIRVGDPEGNRWKTLENISVVSGQDQKVINVNL